ncbi:MAG: ParB/RepB/Spo0J family partition protein [Prolixibacteraceae bacterium]|nr:ParB/RepB/Spo0J family partition protein [Prolixibacteraceae bacterium]
MAKRSALGRGLGALISDADMHNEHRVSINEIPLEYIEANPFQPRSKFDETALSELSASIKKLGLIQPVTLRTKGLNKYQIIAGERRCRASKMAGLKTVPAYIRLAEDDGMLEMALVENIQREDLDAIEVALSYQQLMDECELTQESLSERVGKKRSTISNYLRLLKLPAEIQKGIIEKRISMGHARALITMSNAEDQLVVYNRILKYDLSVRKVEEIVRLWNENKLNGENSEEKNVKEKYPEEYKGQIEQLNNCYKTKIDFSLNKRGKGKVTIPFRNKEDMEKILRALESEKN